MKWLKVVAVVLVIGIAFIFGRTTAPEPLTEYPEISDKEEIRQVADKYLSSAAYSKDGLIQALIDYEHFDKVTTKDIVSELDVDWQKQAEKELNQYLNSSGFSESQIREYLLRDLYTEAQIDKAIETVNPDWKEQARMCAENLKSSGVNKANITATLLARGFTLEQINED